MARARRRSTLPSPALLLAGALLAASGAAPAAAQDPGAEELEPVTLQLRWQHEFQFAGFVAALEQGCYREAGLDVELRETRFGQDVYEELRSGRADYAVGTTDAVVERAQGTPVVALAAIYQHSPMRVIARADADIRSPEDLVGRRMYVFDTRNTILEAMLHSEGVELDRVELVPYEQEYDALRAGDVQATTAMATLQPWVFDRMGLDYTVLDPRTYGIDFYGNTLVTLEDEVRERPERVRAFVEGSLRGWAYALEHSDELVDLYLEKYTPEVERGLVEYEAAMTRELVNADVIELGHMNPGRWRRIAEQYRELGVIEGEIDLDAFLWDPDPVQDNTALWRAVAILAALSLLVSAVAGTLFTLNGRLKRVQSEKQEKIAALEAALSEIRVLRDMLPICASCRKVRDDDGFWASVEAYILRHTSTRFSHGICPDCMKGLYPDFTEEEAGSAGSG